jgi:hypothetical protein
MAEQTPAELRKQREREARAAAMIQQADERPANTDLSAVLGPQEAPPTDDPADAAPADEQPAQAPAEASDGPTHPAKVAKPAKAAKNGRAPAETPWANAHPKVPHPFSTSFGDELYLKMIWLTENLPKTTISSLVRDGVNEHIDRLIREHYK